MGYTPDYNPFERSEPQPNPFEPNQPVSTPKKEQKQNKEPQYVSTPEGVITEEEYIKKYHPGKRGRKITKPEKSVTQKEKIIKPTQEKQEEQSTTLGKTFEPYKPSKPLLVQTGIMTPWIYIPPEAIEKVWSWASTPEESLSTESEYGKVIEEEGELGVIKRKATSVGKGVVAGIITLPEVFTSVPKFTYSFIAKPRETIENIKISASEFGYGLKEYPEYFVPYTATQMYLTGKIFGKVDSLAKKIRIKRTYTVPTEYGELKVTPSGELKSFEPYVYVGKGERLVARGSVIKWGYGEVKPRFVEFKVPEEYISTRPPEIEPYNLKVYTKSKYLVGGSPTKTSTPFKSLEVEPLKIKTGEHVTLIKEPKTPGGTYAVQKRLPGITIEHEIAGLPKSLQEDILKTHARNILVETARSEFYHQTLKGLQEFQSQIPGKKVFGKTFVLEIPTKVPESKPPYLHVKPNNYLWQPGGKVPSGEIDWLKGKTEVSRPVETSSGLLETMRPEKLKIQPSSKPLVSIENIKMKKLSLGLRSATEPSSAIGLATLTTNKGKQNIETIKNEKQKTITSPGEKTTISSKESLRQDVEQKLKESVKQVQEQKSHFIIKTRRGVGSIEKRKQNIEERQLRLQKRGMLTGIRGELSQKKILNLKLEKPVFRGEFSRFKIKVPPTKILTRRRVSEEKRTKKSRKVISIPKTRLKRKKKEKYLPDIFSASVSKFLFGKATPPKRITPKMKRHYYAGLPTQELLKKKVKARSPVSLKRLFKNRVIK